MVATAVSEQDYCERCARFLSGFESDSSDRGLLCKACMGDRETAAPRSPTCPLRPLAGYVVIRPIKPPTQTAGGILLPDEWRGKGARKRRERDPGCGVIEAVGPGRRLADGSFAECAVTVGDKVVYLTYTDTAEWDEGGTWHIVEQSDVMMVVERAESLSVKRSTGGLSVRA